MATTRLMPIHAGSGRTVEDVIEYVKNPEKTRNGELISSYECDSRTADAEFDLSKRQYFALTGRSQGGSDIIAYHTRQAFLPGEVTPEEANLNFDRKTLNVSKSYQRIKGEDYITDPKTPKSKFKAIYLTKINCNNFHYWIPIC